MPRKYVARQMIANIHEKPFAFELLWRSVGTQETLSTEGDVREFFGNLSMNFNPEELTSGGKALVYLPRVAILSNTIQNIDQSQYIFGLAEDCRYDNDLVARLEYLRTKHFHFALCDYDGKLDFSRMEKSISYLKVDFQRLTVDEHKMLVYQYKKRKRKTMIAENILTREDFLTAKGVGYDYFQGNYFTQPTLDINEDIGFNHNSFVQLLRELNEEDCDFNKIDRIINTDPGLTYLLLARGNTMAFAAKTKFTSASQVVVRMGTEELQRWATMTLMQEVSVAGQETKLEHALLRAMFLEELAMKIDPALPSQDRYYIYLRGMFSLFPDNKRNEIFDALDYSRTEELYDEAHDLLLFNFAFETANYEMIDEYLTEKKLTEGMVMTCYKSAISNVNLALYGE